MAKPNQESNSDGLEIVSIGTLYSGQWDKKYWSSSRGKDRYPYPIGYQALRTYNGLTYKIEMHEGEKGPIFQITSSDKQSGYGDTPDRAWVNFQKKSSSRMKLWPGKRASGKVDGVEFFGFKNALVQRLLRELVATINDASEQISHSTDVSKASAKGREVGNPSKYQSPELMPILKITGVTGKRSRTYSGVDRKSASKRSHKTSQPYNEADFIPDPIYRSTNNAESVTSSTSDICEINQADGPLQLLSDIELRKNNPLSGLGLPIKSMEVLEDSKTKCSLGDGQSRPASKEKCSPASLAGVDLSHEEKSLDMQFMRVLGHGFSVTTEEEKGNTQIIPNMLGSKSPVLIDCQVNHSANLCDPSTSGTRTVSVSDNRKNAESRTELDSNMVFSEDPINGSQSEDGSRCLTGSSEKSDFDSFGDDITKSMMAILLPRAIPFLTFSTRKKKKKTGLSNELSSGLKSDDHLVGKIPFMDAISPVSTHAKSDMELVETSDPSSLHVGPAGLVFETIKYIVPDSLDDVQSGDLVSNNLPPSSYNGEKISVDQKNREPCGKSSSNSLNAFELFDDNVKTSGVVPHEALPNDCDTRAQKDSALASHSSVDGLSFIPMNRFVEGEENCPTAEANPNFIEHSSKNTERGIFRDSKVSCLAKQKISGDIKGNMKLIGRYSLPMQISSVKLAEIGHEIHICVSCGPSEDGKRDLFLYKLLKEPSPEGPCMVGYTSMGWPSLKDEFGREVVIDKCGLAFTPDARAMVLIDSVRMPYCREKNLNCTCPQCEACCFEENAVKIVRIQDGYASLILKLYTIYAVHCILVCEPKCLIAVDESGRIYIWIMDPTWSIRREEHIILSYDFLSSRVIELKRVPKSSSMVIGHTGYGQFSVWDIAKHTVVTQFSAPASTVLEYHPICLFRWQNKCLSRDKLLMEECVKNLVEGTMLWFSGANEVNNSCLTNGEDVAVWAFMYTSYDSNIPSATSSSNCLSSSDGCWRLCLLVKNTVIMGAALPSSATAVGTSSGIGIIGTRQGQVDIWELATGNQLGNLHHHPGKAVSHVAVDDSSSSIVAIAHDGGQLSVYVHH